MRTCPECGGARLNRAARFVFVAERTLPEIASLTIGGALANSSALCNFPAGAAKSRPK
jgi:excinuclease UvrABC ATPase subunit